MNKLNLRPNVVGPAIGLSILLFLSVPLARADIFSWTDDQGIKHFANVVPSEPNEDVTISEEIPYDETKSRKLQEQLENRRIELALADIAEKLAAIERRGSEAENKMAASLQSHESAQHSKEPLIILSEQTSSKGYLYTRKRLHRRYVRIGHHRKGRVSPYYKKFYRQHPIKKRYFRNTAKKKFSNPYIGSTYRSLCYMKSR